AVLVLSMDVNIPRLGGAAFYFFFQAEDGIRPRNVTGVQTCALPISRRLIAQDMPVDRTVRYGDDVNRRIGRRTAAFRCPARRGRSEERRVGKERSAQWVDDPAEYIITRQNPRNGKSHTQELHALISP